MCAGRSIACSPPAHASNPCTPHARAACLLALILSLPQLQRVEPTNELRLDELTHLLAILMGAERATQLTRAVLGVLEEGLQETWYEAKLRRKYGG